MNSARRSHCARWPTWYPARRSNGCGFARDLTRAGNRRALSCFRTKAPAVKRGGFRSAQGLYAGMTRSHARVYPPTGPSTSVPVALAPRLRRCLQCPQRSIAMPTRLTRRQFLAVPAALGAASLLPGSFAAALAQETPPLPDLSDWNRVRAQFSLDPAWMHFASFFIASHPAPVRDAIEAWRRAMDRDPFQVIEHGMFTDEAHNIPLQVRTAIARYLGGRADDIALTRSTTESLALVYHGLPLKAGDEVLATTHDHYSHHESIRLATRRAGATTRRIALFDDAADATVDALTGRLLQAL